jgi:DNA polymerase
VRPEADPAAGAQLAALQDEVRSHGGCGFEICEQATHLVPGEGPAGAGVMVVGEAPGAGEDRQGRPFVGAAGKLLGSLLEEAGLRRADVYVTNVVKARPPGNRDPKAPEVAHWMPVLEQELALVAPRLVVPLGRHALAHFAPDAKVSDVHGTVLTAQGRAVFAMYHPAAALHRPPLRETLVADARALGAALGDLAQRELTGPARGPGTRPRGSSGA